MKILIATYAFPSDAHAYSGVFVLRQAQALQALGHDIRVLRFTAFSPAWGTRRVIASLPARYSYEGIEVQVVRLPMLPRLLGLALARRFADAPLRRACAAFEPDIIHAHFLLAPGYFSVRRAVPTVVTAHGSDAYATPYRRPDLLRACRRVVREAHAAAGVSDFIRGRLAQLGRSDARVIFNGADEALFYGRNRAEDRRALAISEERAVVAFVGGLLRKKGVHELAGALAALHDLKPLLLLGGEGPERASLAHALQQFGVETRFLGVITHQEVARVLGAADVVALPSHAEGLPSILCEAMLAGRAIAATPAGGIPEIVRDGVTGRITPIGEVNALAAAIRAMLCDRALRERYEREAQAFALEHLTWRANAAAYTALYDEVLARS